MSGLRFLTLEGIDGAGKSSHIDALEALFQRPGPHGGAHARARRHAAGRNAARADPEQAMDALTEALLVFAARRDHMVQVIEPALARGDVVLCDRFTDATFAYQGAGRGFDLAVLGTLERWVQAGRAGRRPALLQPDITLWFDLPPEIAAQRLAGARVPDKFEAQPVEFFRRVAAGYAAACKDAQRFVRIDADQPREQVWPQVARGVRANGIWRR
jgi:dTMP kinase